MSELESIMNRYFQKDSKAIVLYDLNQHYFDKVVKNIGKYERPDILSFFDDKIIAIEHFEFDSFDNSKKGSDFKVKDFVDKKEIQLKINEELKEKDSVIAHGQIDSSASLKNYFDNFKRIFNEHYKKIDSYIEHIETDFDCSNKEVIMCFFADDVSPLGSYFLDDKRNTNLLNPLYSDEIILLMENSPKIKYLIVGTYAMSEHKLIIIENSKDVLQKFKAGRKDFTDKDFLSFSPKTTGFAIKIPSEDKE